MLIKLLEDNTLNVRYDNGMVQVINSTHSHKAYTPLVKDMVELLPYKGATPLVVGYQSIIFDSESGLVTIAGEPILEEDADLYPSSAEAIRLFYNATPMQLAETPIKPDPGETVQVVVVEDTPEQASIKNAELLRTTNLANWLRVNPPIATEDSAIQSIQGIGFCYILDGQVLNLTHPNFDAILSSGDLKRLPAQVQEPSEEDLVEGKTKKGKLLYSIVQGSVVLFTWEILPA